MNLFEIATRKSYRFLSERGNLTTEDLWELPLTSNNYFDLDRIAKDINALLKRTEEESFVKRNVTNQDLINKLEIVKHIIKVKLDEEEAMKIQMVNNQRKQLLVDALHNKKLEAINGMSEEELTKEINNL